MKEWGGNELMKEMADIVQGCRLLPGKNTNLLSLRR